MMWPYYYGGYGMHDGGFYGFSMIFFWIIIFVVIVMLLRRSRSGRGFRGWYDDKTPIDILKERYAKGEITKEQFEQMKKDLL